MSGLFEVVIFVTKSKCCIPLSSLSNGRGRNADYSAPPTHRSGHALLAHPAPTSGIWRRSVVLDINVRS